VDDGDATALLFLDLSAAFDTIDHDVLLNRLADRCGFQDAALGWFRSYFSRRTQSVVVDGEVSEPVTFECGVPQGSVLGPLLFLVYVASLPDENEEEGVVVDQFLDDTQARARFSIKVASSATLPSMTSSLSNTPPSVRRRRRRRCISP